MHVQAANATKGTWTEQKKMLPVKAFENSQMATTKTQQVAAVGFKRSKASLIRFDLNEQMQVWAELTGGGDSQVAQYEFEPAPLMSFASHGMSHAPLRSGA